MTDLALSVEGVSKAYKHFHLADLSLSLPQGEIMGLIGPNGAGKSTTLKILMGLVAADKGKVNVLGYNIPAQQVAMKSQVGFLSEDLRLYKNATLAWHLDYMRSIFPSWDNDYAKKLVKRFDLITPQKLAEFSHGQRVKAALLLVLARRPSLLILDEPTTGLDPVARHEILSELMTLMANDGHSILFSSHNTQDIEQLSDHIAFIDKGKLIDCQDKETYLDRWQRVRITANQAVDLTNLPSLITFQRSSQQAVLTTNQYSSDIDALLHQRGAKIDAVERMTLEEIFISEVQFCRQRRENV